MKRYKAISLIETLISLAIVGIALIALLPVMTVKKEGFDATKGNGLWANNNTTASICGNAGNIQCPLEVGEMTPTAPEALLINNNGLANNNLVPLNILGRLSLHGNNIESSSVQAAGAAANPMFHAFAGANTDSYSNITGYNTNLYYDANKVVIQNDFRDDTVNPRVNWFDTFSLRHDYANNTATNSPARASSTNYVSIGNRNNEYIFNDSTGGKNIVGIGVNSIKSSNNATNLIALFNTRNSPLPDLIDPIWNGILIGALIDSDDSEDSYLKKGNTTDKFALVKQTGENIFYLYSDYVHVAGINVTSILIASDKRLKNITNKYKKGLKEIIKINPVEYTLKNDKEKTLHVGIIAQDLQKIFPNSVSKNNDGYLMVSEEETFYALLNSIKELNSKNKKITEENKKLEAKIAQLKQIRDNLKASKGGKNG